MPSSFESAEPASAFLSTHRGDDTQLLKRIEAEFREMPGLILTLAQAARLFSLDLLECERVLQTLVRGGQLRVCGRSFILANEDRFRSYSVN